jgi:hypothetical protein
MNKVYRHKKLSTDQYLGRVDRNGKVYEAQFGPDKYAGRVDLDSGKIYEARFGPDKYVGKVDFADGKIYRHRIGPNEYLGRVDVDGRCYLHKRLGRDEYLGKVTGMTSSAHGAAGVLLLLLPLIKKMKDELEQASQTGVNVNTSEEEEGNLNPDIDPGFQTPLK